MNGQVQTADANGPTGESLSGRHWLWHKVAPISGSLLGAGAVVLFDVVETGFYAASASVCPFWALVSLTKALVQHWKGTVKTGVAVARVAIPLVTWALAVGNYAVQRSTAFANAGRIIEACEEYRSARGVYPQKLDQLVPQFLEHVPRAK